MKVAPLIVYLTVALLDTPRGVRVAAIPSPPELRGIQAARSLSRRGADFSCCPTQGDPKKPPGTVATSRRRSIGQVLYRRGCCSSKPEITNQIPLGELTLEDDDVSELPGQDDFHDDHMSVTGVDPDADEDPQPSTPIMQSSSSAASDLVVEQSVYTGEGGRQFSFNRMVRDGILAEGLEGAWNAAGVKGANTRRSIDKYMSLNPPRDRLADLGPLLQPKKMDGLYETFDRRISLIKGVNPEAETILEPFTLSGIALPDKLQDCLYYDVKVISKGETDATKTVLELKLNYCTGIMIVAKANSENDLNKDSSKLYSSDLMWQTWIKYAARSAADRRIPVKEAVASLNYILRSAVVNQETENVMRLAHLISADHAPPNAVDPDSVAKGADGQKLGLDTGHGKWIPNNVSYNYILSTPNVRPFGMMLVDYNTALHYAYITEIHTFPRINSAPAKEEDWRDSSILLVLGNKPPGSAAQSPLHSGSTVMTTGATDVSTS